MRFLGSVIGITRRDKIRDDNDASDKLGAEHNECRNNWKNHVRFMTENIIAKTNGRRSTQGIRRRWQDQT
jgi:hypothetical protein